MLYINKVTNGQSLKCRKYQISIDYVRGYKVYNHDF